MQSFELRADRNGLRPVFLVGNALGRCPMDCKFCNVRADSQSSSSAILDAFQKQLSEHVPSLTGPYHPAIYNGGNVMNPKECPPDVLLHILRSFAPDLRVRFVSINSRACFVTDRRLRRLKSLAFPFRIHFILGQESTSPQVLAALGKNAVGEFDQLVARLASHNADGTSYFGIDVNLLFLPELASELSKSDPISGIVRDLEAVLASAHPQVPLEINIHPYCRGPGLPWKSASIDLLLEAVPLLDECVSRHNAINGRWPIHLFIGAQGAGFDLPEWKEQLTRWGDAIRQYNSVGILPALS